MVQGSKEEFSLALGAKTKKMPFGHHGANHPVRDEQTGRIEITSQNHSYVVDDAELPAELVPTHWNLNDMSLEIGRAHV